jgi:hypothetical protein
MTDGAELLKIMTDRNREIARANPHDNTTELMARAALAGFQMGANVLKDQVIADLKMRG